MLLGGDDYFERLSVADRGQVGFKPAWIADSAFRVVNEAQHGAAIGTPGVMSKIYFNLVNQISDRQPGPRLLGDDHDMPVLQEMIGAAGPGRVSGMPVFRRDVFEFQAQQRVQEV